MAVLDTAVDNAKVECNIPRGNLVADDKIKTEGDPEEIKICLGWTLNTRELKVDLPNYKSIEWSERRQNVLDSKTTSKLPVLIF